MNSSQNWTKKSISKEEVESLCKKYSISPILSSIFTRRQITKGSDVLYYLEHDLMFQHNPFLLPGIEDAVDRILSAKEEGEKVLIFGDNDVDGVSSTAILYSYLKKIGIDVFWRLPLGDDVYGLSLDAVNDFYSQNGTLIITVDCGIANFEAIDKANELGIDVIVTDHHNPQNELPDASVIVNPKLSESEYPFKDISGAAVAYKLVNALRLSQTSIYKTNFCIMNISEEEDCVLIECLKVYNLEKRKSILEKIIPGKTSILQTKLPDFLSGQYIYVWDKKRISALLSDIFGNGIDFNLLDLREEVSKIMPGVAKMSAEEIHQKSKYTKYYDDLTVTESILNIYKTCTWRKISLTNENSNDEKRELQLVSLAALADVMPMKNENRIFVRNALSLIKKQGPVKGLSELFAKLKVNPQSITSTDLSWTVIPALNASGRMGQADLSLKLLLSENSTEREKLASEIFEKNEMRKQLVNEAIFKIKNKAEESVKKYDGKLCVVIDECINKGVTGILASKLMQDYEIPSIAVTYCENLCIGSIRSCRGFIATDFLNSFGNFFVNYGGHDAAAGFSFEKEKESEFIQKTVQLISQIELSSKEKNIAVDAEIPSKYIGPDLFSILDVFEPYGNENPELQLLTSDLVAENIVCVGKKEIQHLKITFSCGKYKIPGMFWNAGERFGKDIKNGEKYKVLYTLSRNYFNGKSTPQFIIKEMIQIN